MQIKAYDSEISEYQEKEAYKILEEENVINKGW